MGLIQARGLDLPDFWSFCTNGVTFPSEIDTESPTGVTASQVGIRKRLTEGALNSDKSEGGREACELRDSLRCVAKFIFLSLALRRIQYCMK